MSNKVLISKEIESLVDADNIFGPERGSLIPISVFLPRTTIFSCLNYFKSLSHKAVIKFKIKAEDAQAILFQREVEKIIIGDKDKEHIIFESCIINSIAIAADEDIYICKIIIKKSA